MVRLEGCIFTIDALFNFDLELLHSSLIYSDPHSSGPALRAHFLRFMPLSWEKAINLVPREGAFRTQIIKMSALRKILEERNLPSSQHTIAMLANIFHLDLSSDYRETQLRVCCIPAKLMTEKVWSPWPAFLLPL